MTRIHVRGMTHVCDTTTPYNASICDMTHVCDTNRLHKNLTDSFTYIPTTYSFTNCHINHGIGEGNLNMSELYTAFIRDMTHMCDTSRSHTCNTTNCRKRTGEDILRLAEQNNTSIRDMTHICDMIHSQSHTCHVTS